MNFSLECEVKSYISLGVLPPQQPFNSPPKWPCQNALPFQLSKYPLKTCAIDPSTSEYVVKLVAS